MNKIEAFYLPLRIESEGNKSDHWWWKKERKKAQKNAIKPVLATSTIRPPCHVVITRVAPRMLDEEDNLPSALKCAKDCIADVLIPGLKAGRADGSKEISWEFKQSKGNVREYGLKIELIKGI
jgi:hypothetical protein